MSTLTNPYQRNTNILTGKRRPLCVQDFLTADDFLGQIQIPLHSVPMRVYPEKGVDPQWFKLERRTLKDPVKGGRAGSRTLNENPDGLSSFSLPSSAAKLEREFCAKDSS